MRFRRLLALVSLVLFGALAAIGRAAPPAAAESEPADQPVVVFVHGAWGGAWQFRKVAPLLEARGFRVYRATLTGLGERMHLASPNIGLGTHIDDVVNLILFEDLHDVFLVGHSYGGMVITGVADRIPDRIGRLVYLDAFLPIDGDSATSLGRSAGAALAAKAKDGFIAPWWVRPNKPYPKDVPHPVKTLTDAIHLTNPAAARIPGAYILTVEKGKAAEADDFYAASRRARDRGWPVLEMEGDHNPHWFQPAATADVLVRAFRP
ncbi:MAG: alpha/beta fold hydrolase [Opitutae bacterium]|nr:alpha/beta fold hydrolase [Opitutae bacterium]